MSTDLTYDPCDVADLVVSYLQPATQLLGAPRHCSAVALSLVASAILALTLLRRGGSRAKPAA